jgi:hypothetical protein
MDRDLQLRLKGHLWEIREVNDEVFGSRRGFPAAAMGYEKTFESVADVGGRELLDEVASFVKDHIREQEDRPSNNTVRREARSMVSKAGYPPDEYLNAA